MGTKENTFQINLVSGIIWTQMIQNSDVLNRVLEIMMKCNIC